MRRVCSRNGSAARPRSLPGNTLDKAQSPRPAAQRALPEGDPAAEHEQRRARLRDDAGGGGLFGDRVPAEIDGEGDVLSDEPARAAAIVDGGAIRRAGEDRKSTRLNSS